MGKDGPSHSTRSRAQGRMMQDSLPVIVFFYSVLIVLPVLGVPFGFVVPFAMIGTLVVRNICERHLIHQERKRLADAAASVEEGIRHTMARWTGTGGKDKSRCEKALRALEPQMRKWTE